VDDEAATTTTKEDDVDKSINVDVVTYMTSSMSRPAVMDDLTSSIITFS
jgi:hypothetical protein